MSPERQVPLRELGISGLAGLIVVLVDVVCLCGFLATAPYFDDHPRAADRYPAVRGAIPGLCTWLVVTTAGLAIAVPLIERPSWALRSAGVVIGLASPATAAIVSLAVDRGAIESPAGVVEALTHRHAFSAVVASLFVQVWRLSVWGIASHGVRTTGRPFQSAPFDRIPIVLWLAAGVFFLVPLPFGEAALHARLRDVARRRLGAAAESPTGAGHADAIGDEPSP